MSRIKVELGENMLNVVHIPVRIGDINYGNHVGNDSFVSIIQEARLQWLQKYHFTELDAGGVGLIMSDLALEFNNEGYYGDSIEIKLFSGDISRVSFVLTYELSTTRNNEVIRLARAKTGMVCYDYSAKKIVAIPGQLHEHLQRSNL